MARKSSGTYYAEQPKHYYNSLNGPYFGQLNRSDEELAKDIRRNLALDSWVNEQNIDVRINEGAVTLRGTVDSAMEKRAAGDDVWDVPGVMDVTNDLAIRRH